MTSRASGCWHEGQHPPRCFPFHSLPRCSPAAGIMSCSLHCSFDIPQSGCWAEDLMADTSVNTSSIPVSHLHPWW